MNALSDSMDVVAEDFGLESWVVRDGRERVGVLAISVTSAKQAADVAVGRLVRAILVDGRAAIAGWDGCGKAKIAARQLFAPRNDVSQGRPNLPDSWH